MSLFSIAHSTKYLQIIFCEISISTMAISHPQDDFFNTQRNYVTANNSKNKRTTSNNFKTKFRLQKIIQFFF